MRIHLIAPYHANYNTYGLERGLAYEMFQIKDDIELTITDMRVEAYFSWMPKIIDKQYDLSVIIKGERLNDELCKIIVHNSKASILWFPDDIIVFKPYADLIERIGRYFDIVYSFDAAAIPKYYELGCKDVRFLPACANREVHVNKNIERDIDISFCAHLNPERKELLKVLKSNGIDVYNENKYGADLVEIYNRSKMVLSVSQGSTGISQRVFEAAACGALPLIKEIDKKNRLKIYHFPFEGKLGLEWLNTEHLVHLINQLKTNETIEEQAIDTYKFVHQKHIAKNRLETILSDMKGLL